VQGKNVLILLGNEGKGFSEEIRKKVPHAVSIPAFAEEGPESLNVAVTCGIFAYVFSNKKGHPADALYSDEQPAPD
ncbi:MAG: hypothetical protein N3F09_00005, partial [Bacteroidia bacterium]|nr:hypothetical protein [Bacteroidia bacterium]